MRVTGSNSMLKIWIIYLLDKKYNDCRQNLDKIKEKLMFEMEGKHEIKQTDR